MSKLPHYFIFGDQSWPVESLAKVLPAKSTVAVWIDGRGWISAASSATPKNGNGVHRGNGDARLLVSPRQHAAEAAADVHFNFDDGAESVVIVGFENPLTSQRVVNKLKGRKARLKILQVGSKDSGSTLSGKKRTVAWTDLMSVGFDTEMHLLSVQDRVQELRDYLKNSEQIAILLQDDPDPDGLAGSLALRKLLGRNTQTAPILSFGQVTRPENVAMARLLEIDVASISDVSQLKRYQKIILLDCQPSFFKGRDVLADVVIDHHPRCIVPCSGLKRKIDFEEIREDLGSVSTLMTQYLRAAKVEVSQRLATALLYGIKSDTLMLNREVSESDLEAFTFLYPRINTNILRKIERPELPLNYLKRLREGLDLLQLKKGIFVLPMGKVDREEWIPQAADFALQFEGAEWAVSCGIFENRVVISGRNCGYIQHSGELFKSLFDHMGGAGGHRSMAKAVISKKNWVEKFGSDSLLPRKMASLIQKQLAKVLQTRLSFQDLESLP